MHAYTKWLPVFAVVVLCSAPALAKQPNVLLILADDLGFADLDDAQIRTPTLKHLAATGRKFSNFYAHPTCGPSRAALMTGSHPARIGLNFNPLPGSRVGIRDEETTLGDVFKSARYRTGYFGKWHLGDRPEHLPLHHGFDRFFGIPYSNDMWPYHYRIPADTGSEADPRLLAAKRRVQFTGGAHVERPFDTTDFFPHLPLLAGDEVVERDPDQSQLSQRFTEAALAFIEASGEQPFFVMLAFSAPHVPLAAHADFSGKSQRGLYGDVVEEMDSRVAEVLTALENSGQRQDTIVVFLSDNGPWLEFGVDGGSAEPFRGGKATRYEGGWRVPAIVNWPSRIAPGQPDAIVSLVDVLPTLAELAGITTIGSRDIDGRSFASLLVDNRQVPEEPFFYFADFSGKGASSDIGDQFLAVRQGVWKLHIRMRRSAWRRWLFGYEALPIALYNLADDPGESADLKSAHPERTSELIELAEHHVNNFCERVRPWVSNPCG